MDLRRVALVAGVGLAATLLAAPAAAPGPRPVSAGSEVRVVGGDPEHVRLVRWAIERFDRSGLGAPSVEVHFHDDTSGCFGGHLGSELDGRVDVCVPLVSEIARDLLLHEMGHAWIDQHIDDGVRARFMELRGLRVWNGTEVPWDDRAYEHGAEIIAWALGNRYLAPSIPDRGPERLAMAFELLTGLRTPLEPTVGEPSAPSSLGYPEVLGTSWATEGDV